MMSLLPENIAILGASGAIGAAFTQLISQRYPKADYTAFSQQGSNRINYDDETSIAEAAAYATRKAPLDLVFVATGILHQDALKPEKALKEISAQNFQHIFAANTITPALIAKHFLPKLHQEKPVCFAALSARVGSISDNQLGGWYAYRASKAALNMVIKTASIEIGRKNKQSIIVALHPGTVDSALSKPFQAHIPTGKLFTPQYAAQNLLNVLLQLKPKDSGKCFAWDGQEVTP